MGVLDDAIRQHLELKRRRGADPSEVKREEDEALGAVPRSPSRREREQQPPPNAEAGSGSEEASAAELDPVDAGQPTMAFDATDVAAALGRTGPIDPAIEDLELPPAEEFQEPERLVQHEVAEQDEDGPHGPSEEELLETPDFMQESPEHDKLWFEQKPPKDFDF